MGKWRWLNDEEDAEARRRYEAGETTVVIAAALRCSLPAVRRAIVRAGGAVRDMKEVGKLKHVLSDEAEVELCALYRSGLDWQDLAARFHVKPKNVYDILERHSQPRRGHDEYHRQYRLNESAFDLPASNEALYWAGMLMADGSVEGAPGSKQPMVSLELQACDREHVEALKEFLGAEHRVQVTKHGRAARLQVRSQRLADALAVLGVTPNKQGREAAPEWVTKSADFWRGFLDGDGCYQDRRDTPGVSACGSVALLTSLRDFARTLYATDKGGSISPNNGTHQIGFYGNAAMHLCRALHAERVKPTLQRKRVQADGILSRVRPRAGL